MSILSQFNLAFTDSTCFLFDWTVSIYMLPWIRDLGSSFIYMYFLLWDDSSVILMFLFCKINFSLSYRKRERKVVEK